jgi:hypothetical protein
MKSVLIYSFMHFYVILRLVYFRWPEFLFSAETLWRWAAPFFQWTPWISRGVAGRPVRVVGKSSMLHFETKRLEHTRMFWKVHGFLNFILGAATRICETANYEPTESEGWLLGTEGEWWLPHLYLPEYPNYYTVPLPHTWLIYHLFSDCR